MIKPEDIYNVTNRGLDIILHYYPNADEKKAFKIRDEKTPSCYMKLIKDVWKITDFGDDGRALNPIDICMKEESLNYGQAIYRLAERYNVDNPWIKESNAAIVDHSTPKEDESEGYFEYKVKDFTEFDLDIWGPSVELRHLEEYNWVSLDYYSFTRKNKKRELLTTTVRSTETFPIYMRECGEFQKIYKPLEYNKNFRFLYFGSKPQSFINGLHQLKKVAKKYEEEQETKVNFDEENSDPTKPKIKKYPSAVFCSGERDAMCCRALGYMPLWMNSETDTLTEHNYSEIKKLVDTIYNIPDLDNTGIKKGVELAMKFLEIRTIWLPEWLTSFKDSRGKARKDLRDYCELNKSIKNFKELVDLAMPMKFWELKISKDKEGNKAKESYEINGEYLLHFLKHSGIASFESPNDKKNSESYIHINNNNIVKQIDSKYIRNFLRSFLVDRRIDIAVRNVLNFSKRVSNSLFEMLETKKLDFTDYDYDCQFMFFQNETWKITAEDIIVQKGIKTQKHVWENEIIPINVKKMDSAFIITRSEDGMFDIDIKNTNSKLLAYLINASRVYWREELEQRLQHLPIEDKENYLQKYKFSINGPKLEEIEIWEQKQHLINKIFAIGYVLHRYKMPNRAWCIYSMDHKIGDGSDSNGRTGKSILFRVLKYFLPTVFLKGKDPKLTDNSHIYDRVTEHIDLVVVDDAHDRLDFNFFFDTITGDWIVNPKNNRSYAIEFELSPKLAITTNYAPSRDDASTRGRMLFMMYSDYYHINDEREKSEYKENRTPFSEFGMNLADTKYPAEDWNNDANFLAQCLKFYLSTIHEDIKINPPMKNVSIRTYIQVMGPQFLDWAQVYFSSDSGNLDTPIVRTIAFENYKEVSGMKITSSQKFMRSLIAFCGLKGYILNPAEMKGKSDRIIQKIDGKACEMIYIKTPSSHIDPNLLSESEEAKEFELNKNDNLPF